MEEASSSFVQWSFGCQDDDYWLYFRFKMASDPNFNGNQKKAERKKELYSEDEHGKEYARNEKARKSYFKKIKKWRKSKNDKLLLLLLNVVCLQEVGDNDTHTIQSFIVLNNMSPD